MIDHQIKEQLSSNNHNENNENKHEEHENNKADQHAHDNKYYEDKNQNNPEK